MQRQIAELDKTVQVNKDTIAARLSDLAKVTGQLADAQAQLAEMQRQIAALDKTVQTGKDTIAAKVSDLAKLAEQNRALAALRDALEKQAQDAAARSVTDQQRLAAVETVLDEEKRLGNSARARIALLNQQVDELKAQLTSVAKSLDLAQSQGQQKDTQIANLSQKLNVALAAKVEELQRYRSEFFGRLRDVLANHQGIQVVGDRFVFQSEVLFPLGSAELTQAGQNEITALAVTIKDIAKEIPPGINWVLRVDGHTDRQPIKSGAFASNWELSAARAITVAKLLIAYGVPPEHLAATGFADYQPLDAADSPDAYAKNRRIELRLTDR
jgi:chemotaxis protein MotB